MGRMHLALAPLGLSGVATAQQAGTVTLEAGPHMPLESCTRAWGCALEEAAITLDANYRPVHDAHGYKGCLTHGRLSKQKCHHGQTCFSKCAVEGIDAEGYSKTFGIHAIDGGIELKYISDRGNVGSRVYLTDGNESYKVFKLKNREFTFDVDVSRLECGLNGALYFVEMDANGGKGVGSNQAGAKYGTGYCDAQCPHDVKWQDGEANVDGQHGMCCFEMDIWEANAKSSVYTPHPCSIQGPYRCNGTACGDGDKGERYMGVCDKDGCDFNSFRMGARSHYGAGLGFDVDTTKPITVVTQFLTTNGTDQGDLAEIRRVYVQDGRMISQANSTVPGVLGNSITDEFCSAQKAAFQDRDDHKSKGGLKGMGEALDRGVVLTMSVWDNGATGMRWLDSKYPANEPDDRLGIARGPCDGSTSNPKYMKSRRKSATVKYTNIKYGEIGSTILQGARRLGSIIVG